MGPRAACAKTRGRCKDASRSAVPPARRKRRWTRRRRRSEPQSTERTRTRDKTKQKGETMEEKERTHKKTREIERKLLPANPSRPQAGPPRTHAQKCAKHTHAHKQKHVKKRTNNVKHVSALPVPCQSRFLVISSKRSKIDPKTDPEIDRKWTHTWTRNTFKTISNHIPAHLRAFMVWNCQCDWIIHRMSIIAWIRNSMHFDLKVHAVSSYGRHIWNIRFRTMRVRR